MPFKKLKGIFSFKLNYANKKELVPEQSLQYTCLQPIACQ